MRENSILGSLIDKYPFPCLRIDFRHKTILAIRTVNSGISLVSLGASLTGQVLEEFQDRKIRQSDHVAILIGHNTSGSDCLPDISLPHLISIQAILAVGSGIALVAFIAFVSLGRDTRVRFADPPMPSFYIWNQAICAIIPSQEPIKISHRRFGFIPLGSRIMWILHARGHIQFPKIICRFPVCAILAIGTVFTIRAILAVNAVLAIGSFVSDRTTEIFIKISDGSFRRVPFASRILRIVKPIRGRHIGHPKLIG